MGLAVQGCAKAARSRAPRTANSSFDAHGQGSAEPTRLTRLLYRASHALLYAAASSEYLCAWCLLHPDATSCYIWMMCQRLFLSPCIPSC